VGILSKVQIQQREEVEELEPQQQVQNVSYQHDDVAAAQAPAGEQQAAAGEQQQGQEHKPFVRKQPKLGRNDPCFCGSGKKYKHCHGKLS